MKKIISTALFLLLVTTINAQQTATPVKKPVKSTASPKKDKPKIVDNKTITPTTKVETKPIVKEVIEEPKKNYGKLGD